MQDLILPSKITENSWFYKEEKYRKKVEPYLGRYYLSYSSNNAWNSKLYVGGFIREKMMGYPFTQNVYAALGNFVGESVEKGEIQENKHGFLGEENIKKIERPEGAEYERLVLLDMGEFIFLGFIDLYLEKKEGVVVCDLKTGSKSKMKDYKSKDYNQVVLYAYALEEEGKNILDTYVLFIERIGSHVNPPLKITDNHTKIPIEYNEKRVKYALNKLEIAAREIAECYAVYNKYFKD